MYEKIIKDGLLISKWNDDIQRREMSAMYLDYYRGSYREILRALIYDQVNFEGAKRLKNFIESEGTCPSIINQIATVFDEKCEITPVNETSDEFMMEWQKMLDDVDIQVIFENVDRYVELLHDVPVLPLVIDGKLKLKIITPDKCLVHQYEKDPTQMIRFFYLVDTLINTPGMAQRVDVYACYDISDGYLRYYTCQLTDEGRILDGTIEEQEVPNYGRIPVVIFRNYLPDDCFWYKGNSQIVDKSIAIDMRRTDLAMAEAYHIPQLVARGISTENFKTLTLDRTSYINIPPNDMGVSDGDAKYITPDSGLKELLDVINARRKSLAFNHDISADTIDGVTSTSGYQLALSKWEIIKRSNRKRKYYNKPIKELIKLIIETLDYYQISNFTKVKDINIDYGEVTFPQSEEEKARARQMKIQEGIWSPVQSLMQDNPDLTAEEAEERLLQIKKWNDLTKPENPFEKETNEDQ